MQRIRRRCESSAMSSIVLDLRPGLGLGPFSLGMPICEAFAQIEQQSNLFDCVQLKYYDEEPLKLDIVISFPDNGFHLRFHPSSQRLRLIEIFDVKRLQMHYSTSFIGGQSVLATFVAVYGLFGPTYPGTYDKERSVYTLFYPGLSFAFPIPSQYADCCHNRQAELPLEFPDGTTPVTCRVSVYDYSADSKVGVGSTFVKARVPPLPAGSLYMEEVQAKVGEELWFTVGDQHIPFGASPQDVWTELGRPCGIHQKQVDQMVIHSASDLKRTTLCGDYFYNYFTRGLDILFDGQTHKIKKFVLHTNYPGHADFNSYMKCNFVIHNSDFGGSFDENVDTSKFAITPSSKWEQVKEILGDSGRAAIQTQGSVNNPFGSTFVYGYPNIALEVMKNGYIATFSGEMMKVGQFQGRAFFLILFLVLSNFVNASSDGQTFITGSYFEKHSNFMELEFSKFIANVRQDTNYAIPTATIVGRSVVGDGSHRQLSSSIRLEMPRDLRTELAANSCSVIIIEKLPLGVFADPFELQHLVQKNVFSDAGVFGDTNLELPSFRSNQSVVEIHMAIATLLESNQEDHVEVKLQIPLHARYPALGHGYSKVEFVEPDLFMCCRTGQTVDKRYLHMPAKLDSGFKANQVTWEIPCGNKENTRVVSAVTFAFAILAAFIVVITSISYSGGTVPNKSKHS